MKKKLIRWWLGFDFGSEKKTLIRKGQKRNKIGLPDHARERQKYVKGEIARGRNVGVEDSQRAT